MVSLSNHEGGKAIPSRFVLIYNRAMKEGTKFAGKLVRRRGAYYVIVPDEALVALGRPKSFDMTVEGDAVRLRPLTLRRPRVSLARRGGKGRP